MIDGVDHVEDLLDQQGREAEGGLVQQQQARPGGQGAAGLHAAPVDLGQVAHRVEAPRHQVGVEQAQQVRRLSQAVPDLGQGPPPPEQGVPPGGQGDGNEKA